MRGKAAEVTTWYRPDRITPAYAGKSTMLISIILAKMGSPPPMRGKGFRTGILVSILRITPAYAGKSDSEGDRCWLRRDHPRLCGEKPVSRISLAAFPGSPPPMRGKVADPVAKNQAARITPAYAGKSEKARNCVIFTGDHPRLCGEKKYIASVKDGDQGSPPPMRGKVHPLYLVPERCRITPAYAGKRQASSELLLSCRDHPRLCGEKRCHARCLMRRLGSPPPMRGKGIFPKKSQQKDGITPAYAGKRNTH